MGSRNRGAERRLRPAHGRKKAVESVAYLIHSLSGWRGGPFTVVDCGWPEAVVDSLVFGTAAEDKPPAAEPYPRMAQAGTILLQNVGRLGPAMQSKLADLPLQLRGPERSRRRLMASTCEPLLPRVLEGTFDDRLFYRLNAIHVLIAGEATDNVSASARDSGTPGRS